VDINSKKIQELRDAKPWSQDELATAAGLSIRTIQRAEREGAASLQTIKAIAAAFQVDTTVLRPQVNSSDSIVDATKSGTGTRRALFAVVLIIAVGAVFGLRSGWLARVFEEKPLAERILGHWESKSSGRLITLDLDGKQTNTDGWVRGNSVYTLADDVISFGFRNQIVSMRVSFDSPTEMVWTSVRNGYVARYTRNKVVFPNAETVLAAMVGNWRGTGNIAFLEIDNHQLKMQLSDGRVIESDFIIQDLLLTFKGTSGPQQHVISLDAPDQITLSPVFTPDKDVLVRSSRYR
jgi:transcriptional regulator with XRE-family HTH domain